LDPSHREPTGLNREERKWRRLRRASESGAALAAPALAAGPRRAHVARDAPVALLGVIMVEVLVVVAVIAVVLGPIVLGALGGLTGMWIGRKYVHPHHSHIHDHEVND
jgi:hypothetical protein